MLQQLYDSRSINEKFIPVLFDGADETHIPLPLKPYTYYRLLGSYDRLYRYLTGQPKIVPGPIGSKRVLPPHPAGAPVPGRTGPQVDGSMSTGAAASGRPGRIPKVGQEHLVAMESSTQNRVSALQARAAIGVLTALPKEFAAMKLMLHQPVDWRGSGVGAGRRFLLGEVASEHGGEHAVVLGLLPDMGNNSAALAATRLLEHFSSVRHVIMCGIAGGVPRPEEAENDLRLGDVVVSNRNGVVQYDLVKEHPDGALEHRHPPRPPGAELLEAVRHLQAGEELFERPWEAHLAAGAKLKNGHRPPDGTNAKGEEAEHPNDPARTDGMPRVFHASIAAANRLLKNAEHRDYLAKRFGVKAVEMEGSGIADAAWFSDRAGYLVVRGICDYCDKEKGDAWQGAAAIAAAAYTRVLIGSMHVEASAARVEGVTNPH